MKEQEYMFRKSERYRLRMYIKEIVYVQQKKYVRGKEIKSGYMFSRESISVIPSTMILKLYMYMYACCLSFPLSLSLTSLQDFLANHLLFFSAYILSREISN